MIAHGARVGTMPSTSFMKGNRVEIRSSRVSSCNMAVVRGVSRTGLIARPHRRSVTAVSADVSVTSSAPSPIQETKPDLSAPPPFTLADLRDAIPKDCFKRNGWKSMAYLLRDVAVVFTLATVAYLVNSWFLWPLYWFAQGTMFWALFVVGHDCGHQSFSSNDRLNDFVGNITHSSIMVPYHGWRISHRKHHNNHGHVENDESWVPLTKSEYEKRDFLLHLGRYLLPFSMLVYPFYLWNRDNKVDPKKTGSHFEPQSDLFKPSEAKLVWTSNMFQIGFLAILAAATAKLGVLAICQLYVVPYLIFVMWLDAVTYLHHHGPDDKQMPIPWYRGEEWSYLRGGLSTIDRDFGIFNKIHHNIETHVVHHLFPTIPHYNLVEATKAAKPVLGPYYREPEKSKGPIPFHLLKNLIDSYNRDHFVDDHKNIVFYQKGH